MKTRFNLERRALLATTALGGMSLLSGHSSAQGRYPTKPIRLLNSSPPGSTYDVICRAAALEAEKKLGQPIINEHRSGAGGTPAFIATKNAPADGYTLAVLSLSTIRQPIQQDVGYSGYADFTWIASLADINFCVVVPAESPFKTWNDLLTWARANPQKTTFGCPAGLGNNAHLFGAEIGASEKIDWQPVPFRGSNDCMTALLGGHITFSIDTLLSASNQSRSGKVRVLATATPQRVKFWPEAPTTLELGYKLLTDSPFGIGGPAGMDPAVVRTLQDSFEYASKHPAFQQVLEQGGLRPWYMNSVEFSAFAERAQREQKALLSKYGFAKSGS